MLRSPIAPTRFAMAIVPLVIGAVLTASGCIRGEDPGTARPADRAARADAAPPSKHDTALQGHPPESPDPASAPDSGVAKAMPVRFHIEEPWASQGANVRATLAFDQPIAQQAGATPSDQPTTVYAGPKDYAKLAIYLHCTIEARAADAPTDTPHGTLASLESVQVFSAGGAKPIAAYTREQLSYTLTDQPGTDSDAKASRVEHVRIPFWEHGALVRDGHPYALTVVVLDKAGKTMAVQDVTGDEAVDPIAPWQR